VVLGPFGGALADRYDRRKLMRTLDLVRFGLMMVLAFVVWGGGSPVVVVGLTVLNAVATTPYRPAAIAATPMLVPEDDLAAANAAESVIGSLAFFAGPAIGAAVVALWNPGAAFAVNALTFAVSAVFVSKIGDAGGGGPRVGWGAGADDAAAATGGGLWADIREGSTVMARNAAIAALVVFTAAVVFQYGAELVLHVFVATDRLGMDASGVGVLAAAMGVGGLVVAPFTARLGSRRNAGTMLAASGLLMGLCMAALAFTTSPVMAVLLLAVEGIGTIVFEVLSITMLQRACPEGLLARVFGLQDSLTAASQLVGSAMAPLLLRLLDLRGALMVSGGVMVVVALLTSPALARASAASNDERVRLAPIVARLRSLGIFGDASQAALERLARASTPWTVTAGRVIFREGDRPDDLYVVSSGTFVVDTASHGIVNRLGVDDWFGEIGLLRRLPRTARVTAETDGELLLIDGQVFIDALSGPDVLPDPLRRTMTRRLRRTHAHLVDDPLLDDPLLDDTPFNDTLLDDTGAV
jgi:CRP-like cAMP-binding protein/predicted MFS family arabinose efflux permease